MAIKTNTDLARQWPLVALQGRRLQQELLDGLASGPAEAA